MKRVFLFLRQRFLGFGIVGVTILLGGIALLFVLVHFLHMNPNLAYFLQALASIEANFVCNKLWNWRDREGSTFEQLVKFHTTKIGTVALNQVLFALLTSYGISYLVATAIGAGIAMMINYVTNDLFVFTHEDEGEATSKLASVAPFHRAYQMQPNVVGIVIPVRNSARTIRACIESILRQDYHGFYTIYIVGNTPEQDTTWDALGDLCQHPRVRCMQLYRPDDWIGRDANWKRYHGARTAIVDGATVVAFLDSQVEVATSWLSSCLRLLREQQVDAVAGRSCKHPGDTTLASVYQDGSLFSEWPRFGKTYYLSQDTFAVAKGLPITANFVLTKHAFTSVEVNWPLHEPYGWEDFLLAWRLAEKGMTIACTDSIVVYRNHKQKFRWSKQFSSGAGAMNFYRQHPDCGYIQRRLRQALLVMGSTFALLTTTSVFLALHAMLLLVALGGFLVCCWIGLGILSVYKARSLFGFCFPLIDAVHIMLWLIGAWYLFLQRGRHHANVANLLVAMR